MIIDDGEEMAGGWWRGREGVDGWIPGVLDQTYVRMLGITRIGPVLFINLGPRVWKGIKENKDILDIWAKYMVNCLHLGLCML